MSGQTAHPATVDLDDGISFGALSPETLATETGATLHRARRVLPAVMRRVEDYAPAAPTELKREAAIRFGGYILSSDFGAISKESLGPMDRELTVNHSNAWRNSGAAALIARYRVRRAGAIGTPCR